MALFKRKPPAERPVTLTLTTGAGETHDDPSADHLLVLVQDLADEDYLILDRTEDVFAQVKRDGGRFLVERRAGSEATHEHAFTDDYVEAHQALSAWAFGAGFDDALQWSPGYGS